MFKLFAGFGFVFAISAIMVGLFAGGAGLAVAQLNGAIDDDDTTITLDSTAGFIDPTTGFQVAYIGKEMIGYNNINGNDLEGVVRGVAATDAKSHSDSVFVYNKAAGDINALGAFNIARQSQNVGAIEGVIMTPNGLKNAAFALGSFDNPAFDGTGGMVRFILIATLTLGMSMALVALFIQLAQSIF